jgi:hypothetical protein
MTRPRAVTDDADEFTSSSTFTVEQPSDRCFAADRPPDDHLRP